jgi:serine/threonine-protein kinase
MSSPPLSDPTYRIEFELGSGGGGIVYKAWHTRLHKHVVIKELKSGVTNDIETQRNEVEALKNVKSEYLPQVYDFLIENGRIFTVMDYIEGDSFDKLLENGQKFTQPQVVKWYVQLSSALVTIHKYNIYHRDVKPANIMLMPSGDICLIDFNAALVSGNDVRIISRSLGYASPEQYEILEKYKNVLIKPMNHGNTDVNNSETELISVFTQNTDIMSDEVYNQNTEYVNQLKVDNIDWKRSDIYSLGATMYHLLTGVHPPERANDVIPVSKIGRYGEGIVYIIEKSLNIQPSRRFVSASALGDAVRNIRKYDMRFKVSRIKGIVASIILLFLLASSVSVSFYGMSIMSQEKEERFYTAVFNIIHGEDAHTAYETSLSIFWDRIDPYAAMAKRLWDDGDIEVCKLFIIGVLGDIAKFQSDTESIRAFGDIYYILGNCYYYQSGQPDYNMALEYFAIAVMYVTDNPIYFRDYAIALARTGNISDAEAVLEKARLLHLDIDSLNLLMGEISFAKREYEIALGYFRSIIDFSHDEYLRYRAYHTSDDIYRLRGQPERSAALLSMALQRIPFSRVPEMTERLADAYAKTGDYINAITLFEQLSGRGAPQFNIFDNLVSLYEIASDYEQAKNTLTRMRDAFPNDYRIPMRSAFVEAYMQSLVVNEERDYEQTKLYYETASSLYRANVRSGVGDPEMQRLELLIIQLRDSNWIE